MIDFNRSKVRFVLGAPYVRIEEREEWTDEEGGGGGQTSTCLYRYLHGQVQTWRPTGWQVVHDMPTHNSSERVRAIIDAHEMFSGRGGQELDTWMHEKAGDGS